MKTVDIRKARRVSFKGVKVQDIIKKEEETPPEPQDKKSTPPTREEVFYSKLVTGNPVVNTLVEALDLVSEQTGEKIKEIELKEAPQDEKKPIPVKDNRENLKDISNSQGKVKPIAPQERARLKKLIEEVLEGENSYTEEEIIGRIMKSTQANEERSKRGFYMILEAGLLEMTVNKSRYFLKGSTPF